MKFEFIVLASGFHPEHTVVMDRCTLEAGSTAEAARGYAALFAPLEAKDEQAVLTPELAGEPAQCTCYHTCAEDPRTACSLSGTWHVHPGEPCPVHPEAEGDR